MSKRPERPAQFSPG